MSQEERLARLSPEKRALLAMRLARGRAAAPSEAAEPQLRVDAGRRHEPFPLTPVQETYWLGRSPGFPLGNVACLNYVEFTIDGVDVERLEEAVNRLVRHHEMLRAVVLPTGEQRILPEVPRYAIAVDDLRGQTEEAAARALEVTRHRLSHANGRAEEWPLFALEATRLDNRILLHFAIEVLIADGDSVGLIFRDLLDLYADPDRPMSVPPLSFRDYVLALAPTRQGPAFERAREYWTGRLDSLPPAPALPLALSPEAIGTPRFERLTGRLEAESWGRIKKKAAQQGLTTASVVSTAFSQTLSRWSASPLFSLTVTLFNRLPLHPRMVDLVGDFTTLTLLEVEARPDRSFAESAQRVQEQMWRDLDHRVFSAVDVVRALAQKEGTLSAARPVVLTIIGDRGGEAVGVLTRVPAGPGAPRVEILSGVNVTPQVWLDHQVFETPDGALQWNWDHVPDLFPEGLVKAMFESYLALLRFLGADAGSWEAELPSLLPPAQRARRAAVNATARAVDGRLLHQLFAERAEGSEDRPAVIAPGRTLGSRELLARSRAVGRVLREAGARPNTLVAIVMEKGWEQVVAALGVLESGAAYLPIDAALPMERIRHLLADGDVDLVLTQSAVDARLEWPPRVRRFAVDREGLESAGLAPAQKASDLAYVIYTSGSTGNPKGVMIDHRGAVNTVLDVNRRYDVGPGDRVLALSSLSFDLSVYDIFGILGAGGAIVLPDPGRPRDAAHWADLVLREGVTIWNSVPALMNMWVEYVAARPELWPQSLRLALLSGDWIPVALPAAVRRIARGARVIGMGGATEASIWSILYPIDEVAPDWKSIPYGKAMENQSFHVLDGSLEPCPDWVAGHLYIGGIGLAQGYWRDEPKSRERFFPHPRTQERLYATGDLGRFLPDGNIEFLGRDDFQVKIQGYRIELGEIEAALGEHPDVKAAAVAAVGPDRDRRRLVGYVVPREGASPGTGELRRFLSAKLPDYMVPAAIVTLDRIPLTGNGKVDRAALPDPASAPAVGAARGAAEAPSDDAELSRLVAEVLRLESVEPQANLLSLGANSLDMIRIGNEVERRYGLRLRIDEVFRAQSVAGLAALLGRETESRPQRPAASRQTEDVQTYLRSRSTLLEADALERFKNRRPGVRTDPGQGAALALPDVGSGDGRVSRYAARRSHRTFSPRPVALSQFGRLLSAALALRGPAKTKYLYGSAGGLYPVQIYLHVQPGRVEGVDGGTYYYQPLDHALIPLRPHAEIGRDIHVPFVNAPIFDQAAFSVFLVAQLAAIVPAYGEDSLHFATLEAGLITQLLETEAPACGLGLCQIGAVDFPKIRDLFALDPTHVLVHSLLGGAAAEGTASTPPAPSGDEARLATQLKQEIDQLSDEEVRALLRAHRDPEGGPR